MTAPAVLRALAPAKINLFLHVGPVQSNGRHPLDSLVAFAGTGAVDGLEVSESEDIRLRVIGPYADQTGPIDDNLVLRAAKALQAASGIRRGASIRLQKFLPVAAGIGGGSSDAAAALRLLCAFWNLPLDLARALAPSLGGDVPVAFEGVPSRMQGEGERVTPLEGWPPLLAILLVNPNVACPTGPVFRAFDAAQGGQDFSEIDFPKSLSDPAACIAWLKQQRNDLESAAVSLVPEIADVLSTLRSLRGADLVRMSGSGATCFAICEDLASAERASIELKTLRPDWWSAASRLGKGDADAF